MPRRIRQLLQDYRRAGCTIDVRAGKGSHRKITHPKLQMFVILSGGDHDDAKPYQENDLRKAIKTIICQPKNP